MSEPSPVIVIEYVCTQRGRRCEASINRGGNTVDLPSSELIGGRLFVFRIGFRGMIISIIGLGLIGGSLAKAIKMNTDHTVCGYDIDAQVMQKAWEQKAIDKSGISDALDADLTFICLHPKETIYFIQGNATKFKKGSVVADVCGIKAYISEQVDELLHNNGAFYVGTHPMAGREFSGFDYADGGLFQGSSFIITKTDNTCERAALVVSDLASAIGFQKIISSTPKQHDEIIAYTSQLAHLISNAYVKSPSIKKEGGFSSHSFRELSRVAKLDEHLWSSLFILNRDALLQELDTFISNLKKYGNALANNDADAIYILLKAGRIIKEANLGEYDKKD